MCQLLGFTLIRTSIQESAYHLDRRDTLLMRKALAFCDERVPVNTRGEKCRHRKPCPQDPTSLTCHTVWPQELNWACPCHLGSRFRLNFRSKEEVFGAKRQSKPIASSSFSLHMSLFPDFLSCLLEQRRCSVKCQQ